MQASTIFQVYEYFAALGPPCTNIRQSIALYIILTFELGCTLKTKDQKVTNLSRTRTCTHANETEVEQREQLSN